MTEWTGTFPLKPGKSQSTVCEGELQSMTKLYNTTSTTSYCSQDLLPKTYTQK